MLLYLHLLLCSELDRLKSELNNPAPSDLTNALLPTPQWPSNLNDNLKAGFEVGTNCLAKLSLEPGNIRKRSKSSAISL